MYIQCTKKLADSMKIKLNPLPTEQDPLYSWHANLFFFDGRKGVILMNNKTRYCLILYGLKAEHFKKFEQIVLSAIEETFIEEGFSLEKIKKYLSMCGTVEYTKTHDRSILGQMKEFYFDISWEIENHLPSNSINLVKLNLWTGSLISSVLKGYPINYLRNEMEKI